MPCTVFVPDQGGEVVDAASTNWSRTPIVSAGSVHSAAGSRDWMPIRAEARRASRPSKSATARAIEWYRLVRAGTGVGARGRRRRDELHVHVTDPHDDGRVAGREPDMLDRLGREQVAQALDRRRQVVGDRGHPCDRRDRDETVVDGRRGAVAGIAGELVVGVLEQQPMGVARMDEEVPARDVGPDDRVPVRPQQVLGPPHVGDLPGQRLDARPVGGQEATDRPRRIRGRQQDDGHVLEPEDGQLPPSPSISSAPASCSTTGISVAPSTSWHQPVAAGRSSTAIVDAMEVPRDGDGVQQILHVDALPCSAT